MFETFIDCYKKYITKINLSELQIGDVMADKKESFTGTFVEYFKLLMNFSQVVGLSDCSSHIIDVACQLNHQHELRPENAVVGVQFAEAIWIIQQRLDDVPTKKNLIKKLLSRALTSKDTGFYLCIEGSLQRVMDMLHKLPMTGESLTDKMMKLCENTLINCIDAETQRLAPNDKHFQVHFGASVKLKLIDEGLISKLTAKNTKHESSDFDSGMKQQIYTAARTRAFRIIRLIFREITESKRAINPDNRIYFNIIVPIIREIESVLTNLGVFNDKKYFSREHLYPFITGDDLNIAELGEKIKNVLKIAGVQTDHWELYNDLINRSLSEVFDTEDCSRAISAFLFHDWKERLVEFVLSQIKTDLIPDEEQIEYATNQQAPTRNAESKEYSSEEETKVASLPAVATAPIAGITGIRFASSSVSPHRECDSAYAAGSAAAKGRASSPVVSTLEEEPLIVLRIKALMDACLSENDGYTQETYDTDRQWLVIPSSDEAIELAHYQPSHQPTPQDHHILGTGLVGFLMAHVFPKGNSERVKQALEMGRSTITPRGDTLLDLLFEEPRLKEILSKRANGSMILVIDVLLLAACEDGNEQLVRRLLKNCGTIRGLLRRISEFDDSIQAIIKTTLDKSNLELLRAFQTNNQGLSDSIIHFGANHLILPKECVAESLYTSLKIAPDLRVTLCDQKQYNAIKTYLPKHCRVHLITRDSTEVLQQYTFYAFDELRSATLSEGLTEIGESVFSNCRSLQTLSLPTSLETIGESAFLNCESLQTLSLPASLQTIGESVFNGCTSLTKVTITSREQYDAIINSLPKLCQVHLNIPDGVTNISKRQFDWCTRITTITLPDSLKTIEEKAFLSCVAISKLTLPVGLKSIGEEAFLACINIRELTLPVGLSAIGRAAFAGCKCLKAITLPESIQEIGDGAFVGCDDLEKVTVANINHDNTLIPHLLPGSGSSANSELTLPVGLGTIGVAVFTNCPSLSLAKVTVANINQYNSLRPFLSPECRIVLSGATERIEDATENMYLWPDDIQATLNNKATLNARDSQALTTLLNNMQLKSRRLSRQNSLLTKIYSGWFFKLAFCFLVPLIKRKIRVKKAKALALRSEFSRGLRVFYSGENTQPAPAPENEQLVYEGRNGGETGQLLNQFRTQIDTVTIGGS